MPIPVASPTFPTLGRGRPGELLQPPTITLGDITLGVTDDYGIEWTIANVKGWFEPASPTNPMEQRAADHGGWAGPSFYEPRVIEIEGAINAADWYSASSAFQRLATAVPISDLDTLYVSDGVTTLQADVRQGGDLLPTFSDDSPRIIEFSLSLVAPDPRRYSTELTQAMTGLATTSGGLTLGGTGLTLNVTGLSLNATVAQGILSVTNAGNMATRPMLTVFGPCDPFTLTHRQSGKLLRFSEAVPTGRALVIDTDKRRALLDGVAPRAVTGTWFEYAPGLNEVSFAASSYNFQALLTSAHRSAWR